MPDLAIRTTFIVGFPGEGEKEFNELLEFMEAACFERLGIFRYSNEEGSQAALLENQVPELVKERRFREGMMLQQKISEKNNRRLIGKTFSILIEGREDGNQNIYRGRTYMDAPEVDGLVYICVPEGIALNEGEFVLAKIESVREYDLNAAYRGKEERS